MCRGCFFLRGECVGVVLFYAASVYDLFPYAPGQRSGGYCSPGEYAGKVWGRQRCVQELFKLTLGVCKCCSNLSLECVRVVQT